jgi:plasmid stabilization system protein ParE
MGAKSVRYHQGASADVKSAVAWYRKGSPKAASDFVAELDRAVATIREGPERWSENMAVGKRQDSTVPSLAISFFHYLF